MSDTQTLSIVILAAGKGTRMKSSQAKVLHEVFYEPMVHHVLHAIAPLQPEKSVVIVGHQRELVEKSLEDFPVDFAVQEEQLGTGHAVLCAESIIGKNDGSVMILCGDSPLIRSQTLEDMFRKHQNSEATLTVMTTILDDPTHYGRIISDDNDGVCAIVEEKDTTPEQKSIQEINAGIYCVDTAFLFKQLKNIGTNNSQGEVYLTDIVTLAVTEGLTVQKYTNPEPQDVLGVNSRLELSQAHQELQRRRNQQLMATGVSMICPDSTQVAPSVVLNQDITLHPGVEISGNSQIGAGTVIKNGALLHNVQIGSNSEIGAYSCLTDCTAPETSTIPPYSQSC